VRLAAIAAAVLTVAVLVGPATAGKSPQRSTITGKITVLKVKTIRVHGIGNLTCQITTASPKATLRGFALGMKARITCTKGVLSTITKTALKPSAVTIIPAGTVAAPKAEPMPDPAVTTPPTGGVKIAPTVNGNGKITAVGGGQIEFGGDITCQLGSSSPSVSAYRVGNLVSYTCSGGSLVSIGPGEGT
jgi:hypothetical protein